MAKAHLQPDVLVLGDHPCAYVAAALLRQGKSLRVAHATIPAEQFPERLVVINPELFGLDPLLSPLKRKLELSPIYGLKFLGDKPETEIAHAGKSIAVYIASFKQVRSLAVKLAEDAGVVFHHPRTLEIQGLDETGVDVSLGGAALRPKLLIVAGELPTPQKKLIGLPAMWDREVMHRYTFLKLKMPKGLELGGKPVMPMSLDLRGTLRWAWLLPGVGSIQLAIEQPMDGGAANDPKELLEHWIQVLRAHAVLPADGPEIDVSDAVSMDLPLAGALVQEGVANRSLLIGPAGGFYTACAEDIYPACWSAIHAADVARKAIKEPHMQDALQPYRQQWGATLGDYLRGPQQNLRFLLPLVYRNHMMASRLADAILMGKSVVR